MRVSNRLIATIRAVNPGQTSRRIILDARGIHHKTIPARNFAQEVANHRNQSNTDVAESLYVMDRLRQMGLLRPNSSIEAQGAVVQAFRGNDVNHKGCHTMPCQLVVDGRFPFQLHGNSNFLQRVIQLYARCTWSPNVVNGMDQLLDWSPDSDFVYMYKDAVRAVAGGQDPNRAYAEFASKRAEVMKMLQRNLDSEPLTNHEALVLLGAVSLEPGSAGMSQQEMERRLADKPGMEAMNEQRVIIVEQYGECDQMTPHAVSSGHLEETVQSETW